MELCLLSDSLLLCSLLLVAGVEVVLQVGQVVTAVVTLGTLEDGLVGMTLQEMFPSQSRRVEDGLTFWALRLSDGFLMFGEIVVF